MADANRDSHVRKRKCGEAGSPTNPEKGCAGKSKTKNVVSTSKKTTGATHTCLLHGPRHSSWYCKLFKEYSKNYALQRPHNENVAHSGGKIKCGKSIKFNVKYKEVKIMEHDDSIPNKRERGKTGKKAKE